MARVCTICTHAKRSEIERALIAKEPYRHIAARCDVSTGALQRHEQGGHISDKLTKSHEAREAADATDLLTQVAALRNRAISILQKAEQAGDYRTALQGIREARSCIELLAEMEGRLNRAGVINIHLSPQWLEVRGVIIAALQAHPEARQSVARALQSIEGGTAHDHAA